MVTSGLESQEEIESIHMHFPVQNFACRILLVERRRKQLRHVNFEFVHVEVQAAWREVLAIRLARAMAIVAIAILVDNNEITSSSSSPASRAPAAIYTVSGASMSISAYAMSIAVRPNRSFHGTEIRLSTGVQSNDLAVLNTRGHTGTTYRHFVLWSLFARFLVSNVKFFVAGVAFVTEKPSTLADRTPCVAAVAPWFAILALTFTAGLTGLAGLALTFSWKRRRYIIKHSYEVYFVGCIHSASNVKWMSFIHFNSIQSSWHFVIVVIQLRYKVVKRW